MESRISRFVGELKRRQVLRAVAGYGVVAFVVLQAGEIILPAFEAPAWILQLLVVLAALGFPLVLLIAWVYALTPRGLERTADLDWQAGLTPIEPSVLPQVGLAVVTLVVLGGAGLWFVRQPEVGASETGAPAASPVSNASDSDVPISAIAVLPLDDFGGGSEDYFAASMHEEIVAQLSRVSSLRVVSRTSVMRYAGSGKGAPEIAAELGVQGIVEGSVTRADGRVRITVQLIHAPTDTHLWANSYEREMKDILTLQAEVAGEIARAIQGELETVGQPVPTRVAEVDPAAMDVYMKGHFEQEVGTPEALQAAVNHYTQAIAIDSTFAPAMVGLAGTHFLMGLQGDSVSPAKLVEAARAAEKALVLDGESEEARAVMLAIEERLRETGQRMEVSVAMGVPEDSLARDYLRQHTDFGRQSRDLMVLRSAFPDGKTSVWSLRAAEGMIAEGEVEGGTAILETLVENAPDLIEGWNALEHAYATSGDLDKVVETRVRRIQAGDRDPDQATKDVAAVEAAVAQKGAEGYWEWLREDHRAKKERGEPVSDVEYAAASVALGRYDEALTALEAGLANRERALVGLRTDPVWDPLRQDPRFKRIQSAVRSPRRPN